MSLRHVEQYTWAVSECLSLLRTGSKSYDSGTPRRLKKAISPASLTIPALHQKLGNLNANAFLRRRIPEIACSEI